MVYIFYTVDNGAISYDPVRSCMVPYYLVRSYGPWKYPKISRAQNSGHLLQLYLDAISVEMSEDVLPWGQFHKTLKRFLSTSSLISSSFQRDPIIFHKGIFLKKTLILRLDVL